MTLSFRFLPMLNLAFMTLLLAWVIVVSPVAAQQVPPSFECSKARPGVEAALCSDASLAAVDRDLNALFNEVRDGYDPVRKESLLRGQRKWLKLRTEACFVAGLSGETNEIVPCLHSVYADRILQLRTLRDAQRRHDQSAGAPAWDVESVLDREIGLAAYSPEAMSALRPVGSEGGVSAANQGRIPKTCREMFTLSAGRWEYGGDTIGENSKGFAVNACKFAVFTAQNYRKNPRNGDVHFNDLTQYSVEFRCLPFGCEVGADREATFKRKTIYTFEKAMSKDGVRKKITIRKDLDFPVWSSADREDVLVVGKQGFYIDGMNYVYELSPVGDYTNRGRDEVIMSIHFFPSEGTIRGHVLIVAYFDPVTHAIRPQPIEDDNILRLKPVDESVAAE